jgi:hypothetical protein
MKISKTLKYFASHLYPVIAASLTRPQNYLGDNWEAVINFWLYLDTLSVEQLKVIEGRYLAFFNDNKVWSDKDRNEVWNAATGTTKYAYRAGLAVNYCLLGVTFEKSAAYWVTHELIGLKDLEMQGYTPMVFPLFLQV